jgi:hypothetical protein
MYAGGCLYDIGGSGATCIGASVSTWGWACHRIDPEFLGHIGLHH